MNDAELLRKHWPESLPWAIRELIIGNMVVGNFSQAFAADLGFAIAKRLESVSEQEQKQP